MRPRPSPRKLIAFLMLILWATAAIWLALEEQHSILLAAAVVAPALLLLLALQIDAEVSRLRHRLLRVANSVKEGSRHAKQTAEETRALEARMESLQGGLDAMNARHDEANGALRGELGEVLTSSSEMVAESKRFGSEVLAAVEGFGVVAERLGALEEGSDRQDEILGQLRSDIEWLEDILSGQANSLQQLSGGRQQPPVSRRESPARVRSLVPRPGTGRRTDSSRRINALLDGRLRARYLEIGLDRGLTFEDVEAAERWGVDPRPRFEMTDLPDGVHVFVTTSDAFFAALDPAVAFDVVFVDGLHVYAQAYRDLLHALDHIGPDGVVVVDDVVPIDAVSAIPDLELSIKERRRQGLAGGYWHGDVFRMVPILRDHHPELEYRTIVGSGNEQLLVWRPDSERDVTAVPAERLAEYDTLEYDDVFGAGVPDDFRPRSEAEAISEAREQRAE